MKFGLEPAQFQFILKTVVQPLQSQGATVWCYGSRARGDYKKFSDLDLMVESVEDLSQQIAQIQEELVSSSFPYKVDLVQLKEFAHSYVAGYQRDKVRFQ